MNEARIKEIFADEEFIAGLFRMETPQEVQAAMSGRGIELTLEEIKKIRALILKRTDTGAELTDEELDGVTGGGILVLGLALAAASLATGLLAGGLATGITVGGLLGGAWITDTLTNHTW